MAGRQSILNLLTRMKAGLENDLRLVESLETGRLYKFIYNNRGSGEVVTYGFILAFNKLSFRIQAVASESSWFSISSSWRRRKDTWSFGYREDFSFWPAARSELPLMMGMKFVHPMLADILKGRKRLRLN
jgi:hypothetical protein